MVMNVLKRTCAIVLPISTQDRGNYASISVLMHSVPFSIFLMFFNHPFKNSISKYVTEICDQTAAKSVSIKKRNFYVQLKTRHLNLLIVYYCL